MTIASPKPEQARQRSRIRPASVVAGFCVVYGLLLVIAVVRNSSENRTNDARLPYYAIIEGLELGEPLAEVRSHLRAKLGAEYKARVNEQPDGFYVILEYGDPMLTTYEGCAARISIRDGTIHSIEYRHIDPPIRPEDAPPDRTQGFESKE